MRPAARELEVVVHAGPSQHRAVEPLVVHEAPQLAQPQALAIQGHRPLQVAHRSRDPQMRPRRQGRDRLVVQHRRKGVVEVVQQAFPFQVLRRLAEPFLVGGDARPAHEEQVVALALEASLQLVRAVTGHRGDDRLRHPEGGLEGRRLAGLHLQVGGFEDHRDAFVAG